MSKLYLHKIVTGNFKTTKDTIIADLNKIREDFLPKKYIYIDNIFHKKPKTFILKGGNRFSSIKFIDFPVEKVLIDSDIHTHRLSMHSFNNAKELVFGENVKYIEIYNSFGLRNIENITIPFNVESFDNNYVDNDLKTITIKNNDDEIVLDIDDIFDDIIKNITIFNTDNNLRVSITSKYSSVCYDVYIKDNKLEYKKVFIRYEIKPNEEKELDLPKLKEEYNCKLIPRLKIEKERVILSKDDYKFLEVIDKNVLKELVIKDENEMSLIPRNIEINKNNGIFQDIEDLNDKLLIHIETEDKSDRYILVNEDLSYVDFEKNDINKIYLDFDSNNYKLNEVEGKYNVTMPFSKDFNLEKSKILSNLVNSIEKKYIKNKEHEILIKKLFPTNDEIINLINIEKNNKRNFKVVRKVFSFNAEKIYNFDEKNNEYIIAYVSKNENYIEEYNAKKLKLKK